jgi:hypothetical protein
MWQATKQNGKIAFGRPPTALEKFKAIKQAQQGKTSLSNAELRQRVEALEEAFEELLSRTPK